MKYSLKNQFKHLLKEESNTFNSNVPLKQVSSESKIYYGTFDDTALSLWNEKDGSGGRGEYTVASHFLETTISNKSSFKRIKTTDFFKKLNSIDSFIEGTGINLDFEYKIFRTMLTTELAKFDIELIKLPDQTIDDIKSKRLSQKKFQIKTPSGEASQLQTAVRLINKVIFLNNIESGNQKYFSRDDYANYDLINSVTTSGEKSKSTDVYIENRRINKDFKNILGLNNDDLTIEVKEISELSKNISGGAGIRLASGSVLAAMQNDIIFCLTIICIITNIVAEDVDEKIGEFTVKNITNNLTLGDALVSLKKNQIPATKLSLLVNYISKNFNSLYKILENLIISESDSSTKRAIAQQALNHLESMYKNMPDEERQNAINSSLDSIISKSINANFLCIILGWDSDKYTKSNLTGDQYRKDGNGKLLGRGQFLLIHRDEFDKILGFSSYQNGGTAYTAIKDEQTIELLTKLFGINSNPSLQTSGVFESLNYTFSKNDKKPLHIRKQLFLESLKKKIISEGGLAGHMMHPYEALDMTPRQIIDRIKEYSTSQKIIEKVDGQNLFFTVEEDGTLMFARNKEDMTHDDLVAKFTGHGAEKPFVEGGNAIKRGVEQWLQSAGPAAEMEIREIFHPDGETKSFINFEIMHPDKPNQIIYDEKYIVFHSIVDYVDGRKTIHSTNKGQRLEKIIRLMDSGITSEGFTLASNRTVNLNELTSVQIEDYVERVKEVALSLGIPEDITLGEGIENIIKQEIEESGINLNRETLKKIYDFVLYGEDRQGNKIKSKDFTSSLVKSDVAGLRSLDLTSASKALNKVQSIISPFKDVFVDLGIDLLRGVKSAYMSDETNQKNIELLRDKLQTAINDLIDYMNENPENYWEPEVHRLRQHLDKVIDKDITDIVATTVEGGVYDYQGDLIKVTGGFAPLNQILGAAYRDKKGIFPTFKQKFMQQESNRRSLKGVFNLIY